MEISLKNAADDEAPSQFENKSVKPEAKIMYKPIIIIFSPFSLVNDEFRMQWTLVEIY